MEEKRDSNQGADAGRRPGGKGDRDAGILPQRRDHVRNEIEQEPSRDAGNHQGQGSAATRRPQREGCGEEYHREQQQRSCEQPMPVQAVADGRKARVLEHPDERRQLPERDCLGRGEALLDLFERHVGGQPVGRLELRRAVGCGDPCVLENPGARLEAGGGGVDAAHEAVRAFVVEDDDVVEFHLLRRDALRMDHRIAAAVGLAQPESDWATESRLVRPRSSLRFGLFVACIEHRSDRVEDRKPERADQEGDRQRRQQELPDRDAGGAHDRQLVAAAQPPEGQHRGEQDNEGDHLLHELRQLQQRKLQHDRQRDFLAHRRTPQDLDRIEQVDEGRQSQQHGAEADGELSANIGGKGKGQAHASGR